MKSNEWFIFVFFYVFLIYMYLIFEDELISTGDLFFTPQKQEIKDIREVFDKVDYHKLVEKINTYTTNWKFCDMQGTKHLGPLFFVRNNMLLLNDGVKPSEAMEYWKNNKIVIDCALGIFIMILFLVLEQVGDDTFDKLFDGYFYFSVNSPSNGFHKRIKTSGIYSSHYKISKQKWLLKRLPPSFVYIRGCLGFAVMDKLFDVDVPDYDGRIQGENAYYIGDNKFIVFRRHNHETNDCFYDITDLDSILDILKYAGRKELERLGISKTKKILLVDDETETEHERDLYDVYGCYDFHKLVLVNPFDSSSNEKEIEAKVI